MSGFPSANFGDRRGGARPSLIVLHYTAMADCAAARDRLCDPLHEVSAHWLIGRDGSTEALVDETHRAWHAGAGSWAGCEDVNSHSIGIELDNPGAQPFSAPQMRALEQRLAAVMRRWSIPAHRVIAHSDMAPERKGDPGRRFDWRRLALSGLSVWPGPAPAADPSGFLPALHAFGYPPATEAALTEAFRLRFHPIAAGSGRPADSIETGLAQDLARRFAAAPPATLSFP